LTKKESKVIIKINLIVKIHKMILGLKQKDLCVPGVK